MNALPPAPSNWSHHGLEAFVAQSMQKIIAGVRSVQQYVVENPTGAKINPRGITALNKDGKGRKHAHDLHTKLPVHQVDFDLAITVADRSEKKGAANLVSLRSAWALASSVASPR